MPHTHKAIGILGGTFDPIHNGHLRTALEIQQTLQLAEVRLMPCFQPVHRAAPVATPHDRLTMVQAAIENEPTLKADDCEISRGAPSYMVDTLTHLRHRYPNTPLCLIMGMDTLLTFSTWRRYETILELVHLIIASRPLYQLPETGIVAELVKKRIKNDPTTLHQALSGSIICVPVTPLEISATYIRQEIAAGKNPHYLLPENVQKYIKEHGIYEMSHI